MWRVSLVSSFHTFVLQQTFEEIRININQCLLVYALVILIPLHLWRLFSFYDFCPLSSFSLPALLSCWRQGPCLGWSLSLLSSPVSCTGHMFYNICWIHFIKKWLTEKSKYFLNFIETEPESVSYISESICPFLHWALFNTVCPKW